MKHYYKYKLILFLIGFLALIFSGYYFLNNDEKEINSKPNNRQEEIVRPEDNEAVEPIELIENEQKEIKKEIEAEEKEEKVDLPNKIKLEVPFTSQAPYAVWDEIHEEACEEASLLMVAYYYKNKTLDKEIAEKELLEMVNFQNENYGDYKDSNMEQLKQLAEDYFEMKNGRIIKDPGLEELKEILANNQLVIIPAAGRELNNPNFTPPGPFYHNLVLIGYDDEREVFITNDPGTRKGQYYEYNYDVLLNAIHDFPGEKSEILNGEKRSLVF